MNLNELCLVVPDGSNMLSYMNFSLDGISRNASVAQIAFSKCKNVGKDLETYEEFYNFLQDTALTTSIVFSRRLAKGVSKFEYYQGLKFILQKLSSEIFSATGLFIGNKLIIDATLTPLFSFLSGFKREPCSEVEGTYKYGVLAIEECLSFDVDFDVEVYVCPYLKRGTILATALYPDKLVGAVGVDIKDDHYAFEILNKNLLLKATVVD